MAVLAKPKNQKQTLPKDVQAEQLTAEQRARWDELDGIVRHGAQVFYEVGQALGEIRDEHLYRSEFDSWEAYCLARLDFSKRNADRLICASKVVAELGPIGPKQIVPRTESQAREIGRLSKVEERHETWREIVDQHGDAITAGIVKAAVDARLNTKPSEKRTTKGASPGAEKPAPTPEPKEPSQHDQTGGGAETVGAEDAPSPGAEDADADADAEDNADADADADAEENPDADADADSEDDADADAAVDVVARETAAGAPEWVDGVISSAKLEKGLKELDKNPQNSDPAVAQPLLSHLSAVVNSETAGVDAKLAKACAIRVAHVLWDLAQK